MPRILCIDYGRVRLGLALSDESMTLASTLPYINVRKGNLLHKIDTVIKENDVGEIVVGLPLSLNGADTEMTKEARVFADKLQELLELPVTLWDERLSSYEAEDMLRETGLDIRKVKEKRDSESARIVLQDYLDQSDDTAMNGGKE